MRAATALTAIVVLASLALAGCVGTGSGADAVASPSSEEGSGSAGNATDAQASANAPDEQASMNLTVEVVGAEARWVAAPGVDPTDPFTYSPEIRDADVEVTVDLNATVTEGGDPVEGETLEGLVNVSAPEPWTCFSGCPADSRMVEKLATYEAQTGPNGNVSVTLGPFRFDAQPHPPTLYPRCAIVELWAFGTLDWASDTAPQDVDHVWTTLCTQTYT